MELAECIEICKQTRKKAAEAMAAVLAKSKNISETDFCDHTLQKISHSPELWNNGWYEPPPNGIGALFATPQNSERLAYDNLRKEQFWPKPNLVFSDDSLGSLYFSPINKQTGIIGDFGLTIYSGQNEKILNHLALVLKIQETIAEFACVGMEFSEIHRFCQAKFAERGLNNSRTITYTDKVKSNIGHTIPWTHEEPTKEEFSIIENGNFDQLKSLISKKRIHLNKDESFKIPKTIAFTIEGRAESDSDPTLPLAFFHLIVTFTNSQKEILANFNPIFKITGMDKFITSKY